MTILVLSPSTGDMTAVPDCPELFSSANWSLTVPSAPSSLSDPPQAPAARATATASGRNTTGTGLRCTLFLIRGGAPSRILFAAMHASRRVDNWRLPVQTLVLTREGAEARAQVIELLSEPPAGLTALPAADQQALLDISGAPWLTRTRSLSQSMIVSTQALPAPHAWIRFLRAHAARCFLHLARAPEPRLRRGWPREESNLRTRIRSPLSRDGRRLR
jgi:hypothetical protein